MSAPRTQRAWAHVAKNSPQWEIFSLSLTKPWGRVNIEHYDTPVLVVPEAAVRGCKHAGAYPPHPRVGEWQFCCDCGSSRCRFDYGPTDDRTGSWSRWQRPRILRAGRK